MHQCLRATIQAMSQAELNDIVDPLTMANIKKDDPHPTIKVFSVGHEGKADIKLPGFGMAPFTWIQAAVRKLSDRIKLGTPAFARHTSDTNSHEGRTKIGQVVGKVVTEIGERLNTLTAIHIFPQYKSRPLDIASIEAEIEFDHDEHRAWPTNIRNVSGIALSSSDTDTPGFPGATIVGAVQAYVQAFAVDKGVKKVNKSEVQAAVKELGLNPSDLFSVDAVATDPKVRTNLQEAATRMAGERDTAREKVAELENVNAETTKKLQQQTTLSKSGTILDAVIANPDRKLSDTAKVFIKRNAKNFSSEAADEATLTADVGKFVDDSFKEFGELSTVFGVEDTGAAGGDIVALGVKSAAGLTIPNSLVFPDTRSPASTKPPLKTPDVSGGREAIISEEMDPSINPLIPNGPAAKEAQKT